MPEPVAQITIALFPDGNVAVNVQGQIDDLGLFFALGTAQAELAKQIKKRRDRAIQIAPAGLIKLPN